MVPYLEKIIFLLREICPLEDIELVSGTPGIGGTPGDPMTNPGTAARVMAADGGESEIYPSLHHPGAAELSSSAAHQQISTNLRHALPSA